MKKSVKPALVLCIIVFALWRCSTPKIVGGLPQDVYASCPLSADTFSTWFADSTVSLNGQVTPANSVLFPHNNNCDFYQWSERMFLWTTSMLAGTGPIVLQSPQFYTVTPPDSDGNRSLIPNSPTSALRMTSHLLKNGPHRLPVVTDKSGQFFEIENSSPTAFTHPAVKTASGGIAAVSSVEESAPGKFIFKDKAGKTIDHPRANIRLKGATNIVHRFRAGKKLIYLDGQGNIIESESGQATGDALMSQGKSLVYYITMVNDVYATFMNAVANGQMDSTLFPTTQADRDSICALARKKGIVLPDSNALAIEIKSSWVETSTLADSTAYIRVMATIPSYEEVDPHTWIPVGEKTVSMALVGMHVVGSAAGHPEMIWATFEHKGNTPKAVYDYLNTSKKTVVVPQDTGKNWLFSANALDPKPNISHMTDTSANGNASDTVFANPPNIISPSNTLMTVPWGSSIGHITNPQDSSSAASNSEILSLNNSIQQLMPDGDVRKNYLLLGATWTDGGTAPNGLTFSKKNSAPGAAIGTSNLANSTMETYIQSDATTCFTCHSSGNNPGSLQPNQISHVFQPLVNFTQLLENKRKKK